MLKSVYISETNCITPLGFDVDSNVEHITNGISGIALHENLTKMGTPFHASVVDNGKLDTAFAKISDNTNLILHSDQGWQYQHKRYQKMLADKGIRQSMSRKGNCLDNACAENFFGLLKTELLYLQGFMSVEHFISELTEYIEWYNNKRIKLKLDGLSPVDYRHKAA